MKLITNNRRRTTKTRGFSFLEVIIGVFLLAVGIIAAISLLTSGLRESLDSRNQVIAGLLTQEGVELVRNIRDNNWPSNPSFNNLPTDDRADCRIGLSDTALFDGNCGLNVDKTLYLSAGGFYNTIPTANPTKFRRKIDIDYNVVPITLPNAVATVTSMVIWGSDFPGTISGCTTATKCSYAQVVLTKWGGN